MSTFLYCVQRGLLNLKKNILFSMASAATVAACVFLFCMFFAVVSNVSHIALRAETTIGISVFFNEGVPMEEKEAFRDAVIKHGGVREISYRSAEEAWESFKTDYFGDNAEELAEAFADDNPLAESDSYEIFLENIEAQEEEVRFIRSFDIVREVNYANSVVSALNEMNAVIFIVSAVMIGILFAISVFLISNTINLAAHFRRRENEIMRMIGATNLMIRAPFVVEGTFIGFIGAVIPLIMMYFIYKRALLYVAERVSTGGQLGALADVISLIPLGDVYPVMLAAGGILGIGMGFVVSFITIGKHLKV
ncbi:MAG: permease-like cell division protein FtsX [Clostridiales bacterium]|nr:permease-like cell division protein FtsX [Clostridiales bacterium]MDO5140305.1 permease-like cell division protein FtsX [Eubacteriales bacterium]